MIEVIAVILVLRAGDMLGWWHLPWGNVGTWFGVVASAAVTIALAVVAVTRGQKQEVQAAKLNAQLVQLTVTPTMSGSGIGWDRSSWTIRLYNGSAGPIHHLELGRVNAIQQRTREVVRDLKGLNLDPRPMLGRYALKADETLEILFKPEDTALVSTHHAFVEFRFTDADGHTFRSAYRPGQQMFGALVSVWRYEGKRPELKEDLLEP
ncbi:hypothetical protein [Nocardia africana]